MFAFSFVCTVHIWLVQQVVRVFFLLLKYYQHTQNPVILSPQLGLVLKLKYLVTNQFSVKELVFSKHDLSNSNSKTGHSPGDKTKRSK